MEPKEKPYDDGYTFQTIQPALLEFIYNRLKEQKNFADTIDHLKGWPGLVYEGDLKLVVHFPGRSFYSTKAREFSNVEIQTSGDVSYILKGQRKTFARRSVRVSLDLSFAEIKKRLDKFLVKLPGYAALTSEGTRVRQAQYVADRSRENLDRETLEAAAKILGADYVTSWRGLTPPKDSPIHYIDTPKGSGLLHVTVKLSLDQLPAFHKFVTGGMTR
jgi:hypothetical protein